MVSCKRVCACDDRSLSNNCVWGYERLINRSWNKLKGKKQERKIVYAYNHSGILYWVRMSEPWMCSYLQSEFELWLGVRIIEQTRSIIR